LTILRLQDLSKFASFKAAELDACAEAARVVLWQFHDVPPPNTAGTWTHDGQAIGVHMEWSEPSEDELFAHAANEIDVAEDGAYAVAMAVVAELGFRVVARIHHKSGADWVMVLRGEPANDYFKLEVSGIGKISSTNRPTTRLRQKVKQGSGGDYNRPGVAVVARFEDALVLSESWR
jgi:hypothetical protein